MKHVKLNGVWYDLAESAEGTHYHRGMEPLRPPNASVVQGTSGTFQLRQDALLWQLTDWSGGEGQLKYNTQDPARSYVLQGVDPFSRPGNLRLGYKEQYAQDSTGAADFTAANIRLAVGNSTMYAFNGNDWYEWNIGSVKWGAATTLAGLTGGPAEGATIAGDATYIYFRCATTPSNIVRFDGSAAVTLNNQCGTITDGVVAEMGPHLYIMSPNVQGAVYEISKSTVNTSTAETALYSFDAAEQNNYGRMLVAGDGRLYFYTTNSYETVLHEVVPSSAAGTGYGRELARFRGFRAEGLAYQGGTLFMLGRGGRIAATTPVGNDRQIFYIDPNGSYGTLGSVRGLVESPTDHGIPQVMIGYALAGFLATEGGLTHVAFAVPPTDENQDEDDVAGGLFVVDATTGGYAAVARYPTDLTSRTNVEFDLVYFEGLYFMVDDDAQKVIMYDTRTPSGQAGWAVSPTHDFNLSGKKILESLEVSCEPLPAGCSIDLAYSLDGAAFVSATIATGTGTTGGKLTISTDSSTKTFRNLQLKVTLNGASNLTPTLKSIDAYASGGR